MKSIILMLTPKCHHFTTVRLKKKEEHLDGLLSSELPFLPSRAIGKATWALVYHFLCMCVEVVSINISTRNTHQKRESRFWKCFCATTTLLNKVQLAGHLPDTASVLRALRALDLHCCIFFTRVKLYQVPLRGNLCYMKSSWGLACRITWFNKDSTTKNSCSTQVAETAWSDHMDTEHKP